MNSEEIRLCGLNHPKVLGEPKCRICGREYNGAGNNSRYGKIVRGGSE